MTISVLLVEPKSKINFIQELDDCIVQLKSENLSNRVISTTVFLNTRDNDVYNKYKKITTESLGKQQTDILSVNYVCQPQSNGNNIAFEIHLLTLNFSCIAHM
jgi:hypothetical protein